ERHPSTGSGIQYPRRRDNNYAGCCLEVNNGSGRSLFAAPASHAAAIKGMPAILDLDLLPDMGRMTGRLPLAARIISLPAPTTVLHAAHVVMPLKERIVFAGARRGAGVATANRLVY